MARNKVTKSVARLKRVIADRKEKEKLQLLCITLLKHSVFFFFEIQKRKKKNPHKVFKQRSDTT